MKPVLRRIATSPGGLASSSVLVAAVLVAIFAPLLWGVRAGQPDPSSVLLPSTWAHPLGTDQLGRDVLLRTLVATSPSLGLTLAAVAIGTSAGVLLGAGAAVFGVRTQRAAAGILNTWLAFPLLLIAMFVVILIGNSAVTPVVVLALGITPVVGRLAQALTLKVARSDYVAAARLLGASRARIFARYILPNVAEPLIVNVTLGCGAALLAMSSLSFLGIGLQAPEYDWGRLLSEGFTQVYRTPLAVVGPGIAVVVVGLAFGGFGESLAAALRDRSSPRRGARSTARAAESARSSADEVPADALLRVDDLRVTVNTEGGTVTPVLGVSFSVRRGEIVGIVGESGSGKSLTSMGVAGLLPISARSEARSIELDGQSLGGRRSAALPHIGVVFQDSLTALNPALRIGTQLREVAHYAGGVSRRRSTAIAIKALEDVGIDEPGRRMKQYPHEFSGGMRQRVSIAMATMADPLILIADEPTTALDVTVQKRILNLVRRKSRDLNIGTLIVSHDIGALAEVADRILVMYAGRIVENFDVAELADPSNLAHPYTRALVASFPTLDTDRDQPLVTIAGEPPSPLELLRGCAFAPRCPVALERCSSELPLLERHANGRQVACWNPQSQDVTA